MVPHDIPQLLVQGCNRLCPCGREQAVDALCRILFGSIEYLVVQCQWLCITLGEIMPDGLRQDKVTVGEALHQCARAEAVCACGQKNWPRR